jgi:hypothetical protein
MQTVGLEELLAHRTTTDIRQSKWTIRRTFTWCGHKMRVTVAHDPYEFQADYYLELFNPRDLKWNRVHTEATDLWYSEIDALNTDRFTVEQLNTIDQLVDRMVSIGQDLLEGVEA